jgi:hypothetical protein
MIKLIKRIWKFILSAEFNGQAEIFRLEKELKQQRLAEGLKYIRGL